jgi:hypothetical protein
MTVPPTDPSAGASLQFDAVEPTGAQATQMVCANCRTPISSVYHQLNQHVLCGNCRQGLEAKYEKGEGTPAGRFGRALLFGLGGGIAGAVVYALVLVYANVEAGLLAVLVGYLVGRGVRQGSGNRGGWKYQALAMGITYLAVSGAYMPLAIQGMREKDAAAPAATSAAAPANAAAASPTPSDAGSTAAAPAPASLGAADGKPGGGDGGAAFVAAAVFMAFALPVLIVLGGSWFSGLMLTFALYQAWKMNKRISLPLTGPFRVAPPPAPVSVGE